MLKDLRILLAITLQSKMVCESRDQESEGGKCVMTCYTVAQGLRRANVPNERSKHGERYLTF